MPTKVAEILGKQPDRLITWDDISDGALLLPWEDSKGLYVLSDSAEEALYIGRSKILPRRVGQLFAALLTGASKTHLGGARAWTAKVRPADVVLELYYGQGPWSREYKLIQQVAPPLNAERVLPERHIKEVPLAQEEKHTPFFAREPLGSSAPPEPPQLPTPSKTNDLIDLVAAQPRS